MALLAESSEPRHPDSFVDDEEPRSSKVVWHALCHSEREFAPYFDYCDRIDRIMDASGSMAHGQGFYYTDQEFDLYWSSHEIIKRAIYARPPVPVVSPRFADRDKVATTASELLERCLVSSFERGDFDQVMLGVRDDLAIAARGAGRVYYEADDDGKSVCDDHLDRRDFLHEPARKWSEVGWVAFAGYMSEREFKKRFPKANAEQATFNVKRDPRDTSVFDTSAKCKVWEVWHKADKRVYWVTDGVDVFLDESEPFLKLDGFFPCPRPAYGNTKRRALYPVPDYVRYEQTLEQINDLTKRVHTLLNRIKVKAFIPAGGDIGAALETALNNDDDSIVISVPSAALGQTQGTGLFVMLPLQELAATIQGLLEARRELINNFYELSGISDIMRGATEADETLGAQQLKQQNGSVRVRDKIDELQRFARDVAHITAEIIAGKFSADDMLDMAQMTIPTKAEIQGQLDKLQEAAAAELEQLEQQFMQQAEQPQQDGQPADPQQMEQQFQQAQQQVLAKYDPQIKQISEQVAIEDVMELLRDRKARGFSIEIETDSTILTDEMGEKAARAEFMAAFSQTTTAMQPLLMAGESGAKLAGGMLKFALAPFRAGRELDGLIDDFIDNAPQALAQQQGDGENDMAALAEAEMEKAKAQMAKVEADSKLKQAELQQRMAQMQIDMQEKQAKLQLDNGKLQLQASKQEQEFAAKMADMDAKQNLMQAQTAEILNKIGLDVRKQDLEEYRAATETAFRAQDEARATEGQAFDQAQAVEGNRRADRGEDRADRQQQLSERQGNE